MSMLALRTLRKLTLVPAFRRRSRMPASASSRMARLTVARAQPNSSANATSPGRTSPGLQTRSWIFARIRSFTSR